jgi:hypothetical protein
MAPGAERPAPGSRRRGPVRRRPVPLADSGGVAVPESAPPPGYRAYLLRCWREATGWRFSLEDPHTGARRGFAGPEALLAFLEVALDGGKAGGESRRTEGARGETEDGRM